MGRFGLQSSENPHSPQVTPYAAVIPVDVDGITGTQVMEQAKAEQFLDELQNITRIIYSGQIPQIKPSATLLAKTIKPADMPFIKKDAAGQALFYIVEGKAGVDIGQPERIIVPPKRTVGEMSMISTVINACDNLMAVQSRTADVYAEEPMRLIVFNYSPLIEILKDPNPELRKLRGQVMISLNRIMYRKLTEVNQNYVNVLISYGLEMEADEASYPLQLVETMSRFIKKMKTIPNISISPHDLRGTLIRQGEQNSSIVFINEGKVKISMTVKNEVAEKEERVELGILTAPTMVGESAILNVGAVSSSQVDAMDRTFGFRMEVQNLLRHLQRYPDLFEQFFQVLLELNYFRTNHMMQKTASL